MSYTYRYGVTESQLDKYATIQDDVSDAYLSDDELDNELESDPFYSDDELEELTDEEIFLLMREAV